MKYLEWLHQIQADIEHLAVKEEDAERIALPLKDPGSDKMSSVVRIVVHHSATETGNAAFFRVLHRLVNGWNDIGYHFVIGNGSLSGDGEIEKGRALPFQGAHARGANKDSIGICLVGNFNRTEPSSAQMEALVKVIRKLMADYSISSDSITLHRLVSGSSTECPGSYLTLNDVLYLIDNS